MTQAEFSSYLLFAALLLGLIGVVNLFRPNKRWLGVGAILVGIAGLLYRQGLPLPVVATVCGLGVFCLIRDIGTRGKKVGGTA